MLVESRRPASFPGSLITANHKVALRKLLILLGGCCLAACSSEPTQQIPELPEFNEDAYYEYALAAVDEVLEEEPENAEALYQKARLLLKHGQTNESLLHIRQAIEIDNKEPGYRLVKAAGLIEKGRNREAFQEAKNAARRGLTSLSTYELLAEASLRSNYFEDALKYSDSAIALAPRSYTNHLRKGQAAAQSGRISVAEESLLEGLKLGATGADVYGELVNLYMTGKDYRKARIYMDKILAQGPADNRVRFQQARILRMTGQEDSAQVILYRLRADSTIVHTPVFRELSDLYFQKQYYDSSLHYAQQVLLKEPEEKAIMLTAARSYDRRRRYQQAIKQYEAIIALDSLQQQEVHQMATEELAVLRGKVRYLWKRKQEEEFEKLKRMTPIQSISPADAN